MTVKKKPNRKPTKCYHDLDGDFPVERVNSKGKTFDVGRCLFCGAIVALHLKRG